MKSAGTIPRGAVDLSDFSALTGDGPYLSLYLPTDSGVENAAEKSQAQWKSVRRDLAASGVPEQTLGLIDRRVGDAHLKGETLAIVASGDQILIEEHLSDPFMVPRDIWGPVADLVPILKARQARIPVVLAWIDEDGADIIGHVPTGRMIDLSDDDDTGDIGRRITRLAQRLGARLVIIGGEIRSIHAIADAIPRDIPVSLIEYGRAEDGSVEIRDEEVRRLVNTAVAEDTVAMLERWKEERGRRGHATDGVVETADALHRGAVDVLLVPDDRDLLRDDAGVVDTLVRDAISTGAAVRVIPSAGPIRGGVGAILRYS